MTNPRVFAKLSMFRLLEGLDMGGQRGQRTGYLRQVGPSWIGSWREDVRRADGSIKRKQFSRVVAPAAGAGKKSKRQAQRIFAEEVLRKLDNFSIHPVTLATLAEFVIARFEPDVLLNPNRRKSGRMFSASMLRNHVIPEFGNTRLCPGSAGTGE